MSDVEYENSRGKLSEIRHPNSITLVLVTIILFMCLTMQTLSHIFILVTPMHIYYTGGLIPDTPTFAEDMYNQLLYN